ncbi:MAG: tetraacyldisaccharide 4'-kinase, partial [Candidatus Omnitrophica bacterium]|nr:tetraacyldisaccharide 4'-kinase [Candidatus Omnitrophota bacterium]
ALQERLQAINPEALVGTAIHEPDVLREGSTGEPVALSRLAGGRVSLLSSIGDPEGFEQTVKQLGATVVSYIAYPDHHPYRLEEWQEALRTAAAAKVDALVTTEKDWIRLQQWTMDYGLWTIPVWILGIRMRFLRGAEQLHDRLAAVCAR